MWLLGNSNKYLTTKRYFSLLNLYKNILFKNTVRTSSYIFLPHIIRLCILEKTNKSFTVNLGTGKGHSVLEVINTFNNVNRKMSEKNNLLVKLENGGIFKSSKWLVRGVSLEINKGQIVTLIGPNGSGKTTTAKMVLDILSPDEGVMKSFTKKVAYVPQKISIDWTLPLRVIDFMQLTSKLSQNEIIESLSLTGVEQLLYNQIHNLSGGEFQRVLIARAIAKKPEFLVLDEPVQGVDFNGEIALYDLIKKISSTLNCGILLISHDLHFVMSATDHVICLNGHICCSGTPSAVVKDSAYIELFGEHRSKTLAYYQHDHDHSHETDGSVAN